MTKESVTELFELDPLDIAKSVETKTEIIAYLRERREAIREAERAGKRISKHTKKEATPGDVVDASILLEE